MKTWIAVASLVVLMSALALRTAADPGWLTIDNKSPDAYVRIVVRLGKIAQSDVPDNMEPSRQPSQPETRGTCLNPGRSFGFIPEERAHAVVYVYLSGCGSGHIVLAQSLKMTHKNQTFTLVKTPNGEYEIRHTPY